MDTSWGSELKSKDFRLEHPDRNEVDKLVTDIGDVPVLIDISPLHSPRKLHWSDVTCERGLMSMEVKLLQPARKECGIVETFEILCRLISFRPVQPAKNEAPTHLMLLDVVPKLMLSKLLHP